jgi:hypothetical protein
MVLGKHKAVHIPAQSYGTAGSAFNIPDLVSVYNQTADRVLPVSSVYRNPMGGRIIGGACMPDVMDSAVSDFYAFSLSPDADAAQKKIILVCDVVCKLQTDELNTSCNR